MDSILGRPLIEIDRSRLEAFVAGKRVAVTGAGGSIGSELCRRLRTHRAGLILAIDHHEPSLYAIAEQVPNMAARLGDVRDRDRMVGLFCEFTPEIIFHAAAYKHVPGLEVDWQEAVKTNVLGSRNVLMAARALGDETLAVLISTDKAVDPVSVLGATKRLAEIQYAQCPSLLTRRRALAVRFGNVLGSSGSVVPKFAAQIAAGGPVTITHPDMTRYFMTTPEACDLVLAAAAHGSHPIYILQTGKPMNITTLAEHMIARAGCPGIEIVYTGLRPGERLNERLIGVGEYVDATDISFVLAVKNVAARPISPLAIAHLLSKGNRAELMRMAGR